MSWYAFYGALQLGLIYGLVALGVYITFRVLDFPDLSVDGSFPMGAAVAATAILAGLDPFTATILGFLAGALCGLVTAFLAIKCGILHLLASILTMLAAFSINIRIMGKPNSSLLGETTLFSFFENAALYSKYSNYVSPSIATAIAISIVIAAIVLAMGLLVIFLLSTDFGLALRATGVNARMVSAQGVSTAFYTYFGLALSNGLVGFAGAILAQSQGFADVTSGAGTIVVGLAAVILGQTLLPSRRIWVAVVAVILGSVLYRLAIQFALANKALGMTASDLNLVTAVIVVVALVAPKLKSQYKAKQAMKSAQNYQAKEGQ